MAKKQASHFDSPTDFIKAMETLPAPTVIHQIPDKIRFLGREVAINLDPKYEDDGLFDPKHLNITVRPEQRISEEMDTLLHEVLHCIDHLMNTSMSERQVRLMATGLIAIFQDNPEFAEYITQPLGGNNI